MTQRELADRASVTLTYISKLEAAGAAPGIDLLERLAIALRVGINDLLPVAAKPETIKSHREEVSELFDAVLNKAGHETLSMLSLFLERLNESPAVKR